LNELECKLDAGMPDNYSNFDCLRAQLRRLSSGKESRNSIAGIFNEYSLILFEYLRNKGYTLYGKERFDPEVLLIAKKFAELKLNIDILDENQSQICENENDQQIDYLKKQRLSFKRALIFVIALTASSVTGGLCYGSQKMNELRTQNTELKKEKDMYRNLLESCAKENKNNIDDPQITAIE
jgi:hypothetical protein